MTAQVVPLRRPSAGPCNSGTVPGEVSAPCGDPETRLFAAGPRCGSHLPPSKDDLLARVA